LDFSGKLLKRLWYEVHIHAHASNVLTASTQKELSLPVSQALALFAKIVQKVSKKLTEIQKAAIIADMPVPPSSAENEDTAMATWKPIETNLDTELNEAGDEVENAFRERQREIIDSLDISK
jgi:N-acetyltransferase 10